MAVPAAVPTIRYSYKTAPTILRFAQSDAFMRGLMGPFGSGKSSGCVIEILRRGLAQKPGADGIRRSRWAVIRNVYRQLEDTTIRTVEQWAPFHLFGNYIKADHRFLVQQFPQTEIEILFRALDRPDHIANLLSLELTGAWVNEAREIPWTIIETLQARVGRYPAQSDGGASWHGVIMDTNPPDVGSKWYNFFEEKRLPGNFAAIFKQPSGLSDQAENTDNLPGGRAYYEKLALGKTDEWVKVYIHGQYGFVIDGRPVFPEYDDRDHVWKSRRPGDEMHISPEEPIYRGWDFGLTPACVFLQREAGGRIIVFDELVAESMGVDRFSDDVLAHSSTNYPGCEFIDIGDPAGSQRAQTDEKTCFQILHSKGIWIEPGEQSLAIRLESVRKPLRQRNGFLLHPNCKTLRKALQGGYQYRRMQVSGERYTDKPDKNWASHCCDALQYPLTRIFGGGLTTPKERPVEDDYEFDFAQASRSAVTGY